MIKESKTTVPFIIEKETKKEILQLIEREKQNGRKMTFSSYMDELVREHIELKKFFSSQV